MDILNSLSAKQFIVILVLSYFLISKYDTTKFIPEFFYSIKKRYSLPSTTHDSHYEGEDENEYSKNNKMLSKKIDLTNYENNKLKILNEEREAHLKNTADEGDDTDIFCNKKTNKTSQYEEKFHCNLKFKPKSKDILIPNNCVPYNFGNNKDNNILYSINPVYTQNKINYEKQLDKNSVSALNHKILHTNFDKDIDYYKVSRRIDTILNLNRDISVCSINNVVKLPKEMKLFTRKIGNKIVINWNLPILPSGYFPKEHILLLSNEDDLNNIGSSKYADMYNIPFHKTACKFKTSKFTINTTIFDDRICHSLVTDMDKWYDDEIEDYFISSKVYLVFEFYDDKKIFQKAVIESNVSNL